MFSWLNHSKLIYIFSNIFVLPTLFIPNIDFLSNLSFIVIIFLLFKANYFLSLLIGFLLILKNNANYRFNLLLKVKGEELSKSDYECVYLYAWCTLLRYSLIGISVNQVFSFLNKNF